MCEKKQKEAVYQWLNETISDHQEDLLAVTLTFKQAIRTNESAGAGLIRLDRQKAEKNMRHFLNLLNQRVLGKRFRRFNKRLISVPVYEQSESTRFHAHLVLQKPSDKTLEEFTEVIESCWQRCDFGYKNIDVQLITDSGWLAYMLKDRTKMDGAIDAIDFLNCHLVDHRLDQNTRW